jgi:ribosomal protein L40E
MIMPAGWKKPSDQVAGVSEQTLWRNEITKGIFNKKVSEVHTITNYRVMQNDSEVLLKDINDIVVMNQHRASQSQYTGTSTDRYARVGFGSSRSTSKMIGHLVFIYQGRPYITFSQISDPHSVARLAKAARRQILAAIKAAEKIEARSKKEQEKRPNRERNAIICLWCNNTNPQESKYCKNCGFRLSETTNLAHSNMAPATSYPITETKYLMCELSSYGIRIQYPSNWLKVERGLKSPLIIAFK